MLNSTTILYFLYLLNYHSMMVKKIVVGLNLSHDSSCTFHDENGRILLALAEERFTRRKNEQSFPIHALEAGFDELKRNENFEISHVVIGSHRNPLESKFSKWYQYFNPPSYPGWPNEINKVPPGDLHLIQLASKKFLSDSKNYVEHQIRFKFSENNLNLDQSQIIWLSHHDAHSASGAFGAPWRNESKETLSFSLDGLGDDESGVVQLFTPNGFISDLTRIPGTDSLGLVYSAVTEKYGFKKNRHEGKITGLAALGNDSAIVTFLFSSIKIINGVPRIDLNRGKLKSIIKSMFNKTGLISYTTHSARERLIETASSMSPNYADLAYAIQEVIEVRICEFVEYWIRKTNVKNLTFGGGVFSNVKVNQRVAELHQVDKVFIFPNMGDGGLAAGGVWRYLSDKNKLSHTNLFSDMYLGPTKKPNTAVPLGIKFLKFANLSDLSIHISKLLASGLIGGSFIGRMEFGPRALCNRSILASPFDHKINLELNSRLKRTEFMPFAPVVLHEFARDIFELDKFGSLDPFKYMTITCNVRNSWRDKIPAVIHVDGTARPQFLNADTNPIVFEILQEFLKLTSVPVLVNTSFNTHEEPITECLEQAFDALLDNKVDFIFDEENLYCKDSFNTFF